jgi:hypothetical protein
LVGTPLSKISVDVGVEVLDVAAATAANIKASNIMNLVIGEEMPSRPEFWMDFSSIFIKCESAILIARVPSIEPSQDDDLPIRNVPTPHCGVISPVK